MKVYLTTLLLCITMGIHELKAQFTPTINSGRPGQAIGPQTLGKSVFQIQMGYTYRKANQFEGQTFLESNTQSNILRFGLLERVEFNALINWTASNYLDGSEYSSIGGLSQTEMGLRWSLTDNVGVIPAIGVQSRLLLKAASPNFRRNKVGYNLVLATSNIIFDNLFFNSNWAIIDEGNSMGLTTFYAANFVYNLSSKLSAFIEVYGGLKDFTTYLDFGLAWLLKDDFLLDMSFGLEDKISREWYLDFGISTRVDWREESSIISRP